MVLPVVLQMMLYGVHVDVMMVQRALGVGAVQHGVSRSPASGTLSRLYATSMRRGGRVFVRPVVNSICDQPATVHVSRTFDSPRDHLI